MNRHACVLRDKMAMSVVYNVSERQGGTRSIEASEPSERVDSESVIIDKEEIQGDRKQAGR